MRCLGMAAAFGAILAAVMNIIWFSRHLSGFGVFVSVAWPAVLGTAAFMAFTVLLGIVTVRLMLRRDAEDEARAEEAAAEGESAPGRVNGTSVSPSAAEGPEVQLSAGSSETVKTDTDT